jgi:hypothetical protein
MNKPKDHQHFKSVDKPEETLPPTSSRQLKAMDVRSLPSLERISSSFIA